MKYIVLSKEGNKIEISEKFVKMSNLLQVVFENNNNTEYLLRNVSSETLNLIIALINCSDNFPKIKKPLPETGDGSKLFGNYHNFFLGISKQQLFDIVMAANYMDMPELLEFCCARIASEMRGKNSEEIKKYLEL